MANNKIKVGIIGCGGIAHGKHMCFLSQIDEVEMVAFCDIVEEKAEKACDAFGTIDATFCTDYKELLKNPDIVAVYVLTPNWNHAEISIAAMEAGKHVMCEKPMAKTYKEAKAMLDTSLRTGMKLTIGYQQRWRPDSLYLKEVVENGDLGDIYYARAVALRRRAVPTWGVFLDEEKQGGGPLIDIGTHALDLTLWMMDNYKPKMVVGTQYRKLADQTRTANAWGDWDPSIFTTEDSAFGFIVMENGATIVLESAWAINIADAKEAVCLLAGDKAGADMLRGENKLRINSVKNGRQIVEEPSFEAGGVAFFDGSGNDCSELEARAFINAIINDTEPPTRADQALVVTQILEAIYESSKTGQPVYFNADEPQSKNEYPKKAISWPADRPSNPFI